MSLFRTFNNTGDFSPLFRLLDDYDVHRSTKGTPSVRSFAPRFDVRETSEAYLLDGELPGTAQKDVDIEFTDHQTLVIKGRNERQYHTSTPEAEETSADSESSEVTQTSEKDVTQTEKAKNKTKNKHHYWASERSVGEFHRTFTFPNRVDQENVKANLNNGILSVVVPKSSVPTGKKITIG
ncbi:hypothetical protein FE257_007439 [Aspergillus nanangensis]|uniref:SHSP domain-containing protein n=1 Tax=Aspergillus nanangensis TaxID=2582783 RepID=A0AAD4CMM1_ASPNN|nr:hypothetical protein FE257_007439 [Aspergillus nanangensis]